MLYIGDIDC